MKKSNKLAPLLENDAKGWRSEKRKLAAVVAQESVDFFQDNFRRQGFKDSSVQKWKPRKGEKRRTGKTRRSEPNARGILIGKGSGQKLYRSLRKIRVSSSRVTVGSTVHYAGVHNYGLRAGRGAGFKMPQRKFVGNSAALHKVLRKIIKRRIDKAFSK